MHADTAIYPNPAHVDSVPPADSTAKFWHSTEDADEATRVLFVLSSQAGSVLDLTLKLRMIDTEGAQSGPTGTGLTAGKCYFNLISTVYSPASGVNTFTP